MRRKRGREEREEKRVRRLRRERHREGMKTALVNGFPLPASFYSTLRLLLSFPHFSYRSLSLSLSTHHFPRHRRSLLF